MFVHKEKFRVQSGAFEQQVKTDTATLETCIANAIMCMRVLHQIGKQTVGP